MRMYIQLIGSTPALPSGAAEIAPTPSLRAPLAPPLACPGRNGTRSATTQSGPTPGPPPPCGMQKVLCRLRWLDVAAELARRGDADQRVHVRAVDVHPAAVAVNDLAQLAHAALEHAVGATGR